MGLVGEGGPRGEVRPGNMVHSLAGAETDR